MAFHNLFLHSRFYSMTDLLCTYVGTSANTKEHKFHVFVVYKVQYDLN